MLEDLLVEVASATDLREGPEGVRRLLSLAEQRKRIGIRELARLARLPVPVVAAARAELERRGLFRRDHGIVLTEKGSGAPCWRAQPLSSGAEARASVARGYRCTVELG